MTIWQEEIFGPVLIIATYESEEEALALANDSIYGLSGGVWSADEERAMAFARGMRTGQVSINGGPFNISTLWWLQDVGNGKELGLHGLEEFLEIRPFSVLSNKSSPRSKAASNEERIWPKEKASHVSF